jgi:hypothetical protein
MHLLTAFIAAITMAFLVLSSSATPSARTYQDIHDYAIAHGGTDDFTANLIAKHIGTAGKAWDDPYDNDIVLDSGGVLRTGPLTPPTSRLDKRQSYTPPDGMTGFPYTYYCDDDYVYYTWSNVGNDECFSYWSGGELLTMESVYVNFSDGWGLLGYWSDDDCGGSYTEYYYSVDCLAAGSSAWQSVRAVG